MPEPAVQSAFLKVHRVQVMLEFEFDIPVKRRIHPGHWSNERLSCDDLRNFLRDAIESLDVSQARQDVRPFVRNPEVLDIWSKDFFMSLVDRIEMK